MTKERIKSVLDRCSWPVEEQEELIAPAREIESRRTGVYVMSDEEPAAVREGHDRERT
jgi:hypothetical protein